MSKEQIRFVSLGIESYGRINKDYKPKVVYPEWFAEQIKSIDPEGGLLVVFPDGYRVALLEGDQGAGKTSVITCLRESFGNIAAPDFAVNTTDNNKRFSERIWGKDGHLYEIRGTKSTYVLERIDTDENGKPITNEKGHEQKSEVKSAKNMVLKLVGAAGVDPTTLKNMSGEEQVKWIRSLYNLPAEALKLEAENAAKRLEAYNSRTKANGMHKQYSTLVNASQEFRLQDWEENEKYFTETKFDDVQEKVKAIQERFAEYTKNEQGVSTLKNNLSIYNEKKVGIETDITDVEAKIAELQKQLETLKENKAAVEQSILTTKGRIEQGENWLADNISVKQENEQISETVRLATEFNAKKERWNAWKENKKQMDHFADESVRLTNKIDACDQWKQEFIKTFTPSVPGLEICIPDENEKRHGLIYKGQPSMYWSESESWEVATQLWEQLGTRIIFIENVSSLGSAAIEKFNEFVKNGGYIFGSLMNRKEKNLKVTIINELPND